MMRAAAGPGGLQGADPLGVELRGRPGAAIRTRQLTVRAAATGAALRLVTTAALRRRIQRAGGATATVSMRLVDAAGAAHRVTAKLRLLPATS